MFPIRTSIAIRETQGVVVGLILANVVVFLLQQSLPPDLAQEFILRNALVPAKYSSGITLETFTALITNAFMHGGWGHLLINMWVLWVFGRPLEQRLGVWRFVLLYLASGIIASLVHLFANLGSPIPALGASGAIAGVLGAFTLLHPRSRILFFGFLIHEVPAVLFTATWLAIQVVQGVTDFLSTGPQTGGIAWWAHIGGFAGGLVLVSLLGRVRSKGRVVGMIERSGELVIGAPVTRGRSIGPVRPRQITPFRDAGKRGLSGRPRRSQTSPASAGGVLELSQPRREKGGRGASPRSGDVLEHDQPVPAGINRRPTFNLRKFAVELTGGRRRKTARPPNSRG